MPDLYVAPGLDYVPVEGEVVLVEYLPSGRPLLVVELRNRHRIRAILNNDDIHSDSLPAIGSHVECVQHQGLWSYVRTLEVLQGRATIGVQGAGVVVSGQQATLYSTPQRFLGLSDDGIVLNGPANQLVISTVDMELTGISSGAIVGDGIRLTGGRNHAPSTSEYEPVVGRPASVLFVDSEQPNPGATDTADAHSHDMPHVHTVDFRTQLRFAERVHLDDALMGTAQTPEPAPAPNPLMAAAVAAPTAQAINDDFAANRRTYTWSAVAGALWYNVRWLASVISTPSGITNALAGTFGTLSEGLIATQVDGASLTIPVALRADFFDNERNIGRTRAVGELVGSDFEEVTVRQIEVVGFQVQAQVDGPLRPTIWSQPYFVYYVDWER